MRTTYMVSGLQGLLAPGNVGLVRPSQDWTSQVGKRSLGGASERAMDLGLAARLVLRSAYCMVSMQRAGRAGRK